MNSRFARVKGKNHCRRLSKTNHDDGQDWTQHSSYNGPQTHNLMALRMLGQLVCCIVRKEGELNQNKGEKFPSKVCAPTEPTLALPLVQCCLGNSYLIENSVHEMKMVWRWGALLIRSFLSDFSSLCCQNPYFGGVYILSFE